MAFKLSFEHRCHEPIRRPGIDLNLETKFGFRRTTRAVGGDLPGPDIVFEVAAQQRGAQASSGQFTVFAKKAAFPGEKPMLDIDVRDNAPWMALDASHAHADGEEVRPVLIIRQYFLHHSRRRREMKSGKCRHPAPFRGMNGQVLNRFR